MAFTLRSLSADKIVKVDFVVSCAAVLAKHCEQDSHLMEALKNTQRNLRVSVDSDLLNDLLSAVREMQQGGKAIEALDAFKQLDLMEVE